MEPTDALADAPSGEGDAGAPLDAKQLREIAETGNHFFILFVLHYNSYFTCLCGPVCVFVCVCVCVCVFVCVCVQQLTLTLKMNVFIYRRLG